jgi:hypothetical protein
MTTTATPVSVTVENAVGGTNVRSTLYIGAYRGAAASAPRAWVVRRMREQRIRGRLISWA